MVPPSQPPELAFVPARYYDALCRYVAERGHSAAALLDGTGVSEALLAAEDGYLTLAQVETIVLRAASLAPGEDAALELGRRFEVPSHGAFGLALLTAKDVDAALAVACRYFALVIPFFELDLAGDGDPRRIRLRARWPLDPRVERFHLIALCASVVTQSRLLLRDARPLGIELDAVYPAPPDLAAWTGIGGVALRFGCPAFEARIPAALAATPLPLAHARSHAAACKTLDALLAARPDPARFASTVRRQLERAGPPVPDVERVARALGTSTRTLRRRLAVEGTSFRSLLEEARVALADEWLATGERSITEIGLELGYSDAANFTRAYRRARGRPPTEARRGARTRG